MPRRPRRPSPIEESALEGDEVAFAKMMERARAESERMARARRALRETTRLGQKWSLRLHPDLARRVVLQAEAERSGMSEMIRTLILRGLKLTSDLGLTPTPEKPAGGRGRRERRSDA